LVQAQILGHGIQITIDIGYFAQTFPVLPYFKEYVLHYIFGLLLVNKVSSGNIQKLGIVESEQGLERILLSLFQKGKKKLVIDIGLPFFQRINGFKFPKLSIYLSWEEDTSHDMAYKSNYTFTIITIIPYLHSSTYSI
jgi:hypothetical protein